MTKKEEGEKNETGLSTVTKEHLALSQNLGMRGVDRSDIRPPSVLLMQALSHMNDFTDSEGKHPTPGQYFHNGVMRILNEFECYFLWAGKGEYTDKRKPELGAQKVYRAIGVMADDMSMFGMRFKSSSLYTLSSLFTAVTANKRGMYSIRVKMGVKSLENDKGIWTIPTLAIVAMEDDVKKLQQLEKLAMIYDTLGTAAAPKAESGLEEDVEDGQEAGATPAPGENMNENVNPADIPF